MTHPYVAQAFVARAASQQRIGWIGDSEHQVVFDGAQLGFVGDALEVVARGVRPLEGGDLLAGELDVQRSHR